MTSSISGTLPQQIDLVVEKRAVEDGHDGLGRMNRERPQTRALAPGEENRFHVNRPILPHEVGRMGLAEAR